nr:signal peptidase I [uncultured Lachnoclostridium sp.]
MNEEDKVKESLEFCEDIYTYYEKKGEDEHLYSQYNKATQWKEEPVSYTEKYSEMKKIEQEEDASEEAEKQNFYYKEILPIILCVVVAFAVAKLLSAFVIQITVVHGDSMEATVSDKDKLFVGKLSYLNKKPERFDVIVFTKGDKTNLIKRVIGLPGEKVEIKKGVIYIDGKRLKEHYGLDPINPESEPLKMELKADEYFVLGDNRSVSLDSRYSSIGAIREDEIIGKALVRVYPLNKMCVISK